MLSLPACLRRGYKENKTVTRSTNKQLTMLGLTTCLRWGCKDRCENHGKRNSHVKLVIHGAVVVGKEASDAYTPDTEVPALTEATRVQHGAFYRVGVRAAEPQKEQRYDIGVQWQRKHSTTYRVH